MAQFNPDVARNILLDIENAPPVPHYFDVFYDDQDKATVSYHIKMLAMDGLIEARDDSTLGGLYWRVRSLTPQGHRFLDAIKSDTLWQKVLSSVKAAGLGMSLSILKAYAAKVWQEQTGTPISF